VQIFGLFGTDGVSQASGVYAKTRSKPVVPRGEAAAGVFVAQCFGSEKTCHCCQQFRLRIEFAVWRQEKGRIVDPAFSARSLGIMQEYPPGALTGNSQGERFFDEFFMVSALIGLSRGDCHYTKNKKAYRQQPVCL